MRLPINTTLLETELRGKTDAAAALLAKTARECEAHEEKDADGKVTAKGRLMTADERQAIQKIIDDANGIRAQLAEAKTDESLRQQIEKLTSGMTRGDAADTRRVAYKSLGRQWVESESGQFFTEKRHHGSRNWNSPVSELIEAPSMRATTLTEDVASGGKLLVPQYLPGITPLMFKRLTIRDLLASGQTDSPQIVYMVEKTFTNAAAAVAEGAAKPESALVFDQKVESVVKIAHWLPVTEEMLEDVSQIQSYIDARLRLGLDLTEEDQLLNGSGVAPNMLGLLNRVGLTVGSAVGAAPDTNADAIFRTMMAVFNASFVMPDGHVINPANWQTIALMKTTYGEYIAGGPFSPLPVPTLWGLPVDVTPSIVANTAFTGAFATQAQVFDRGGVRVEASNSHQDFFIKNLVAIRAERREALCVYRPAAFAKTTALT
jgi:HK97 family phage major capsid protein